MTPRVVAIGGVTTDALFRTERPIEPATSNPAQLVRSFGGVARNVAVTLARLGVPVTLCSAVGDDDDGERALADLSAWGVDASAVVRVRGMRTASYAAICGPDGTLFAAACDARVFEAIALADAAHLDRAAWVFLDANPPPALIAHVLASRAHASWRLALDATSAPKASGLPHDLSAVDVLFANEREASVLGETSPQAAVVTRGARGVTVAQGGRQTMLDAPPAAAVDETGAGDALVAGTLDGLVRGRSLVDAVRAGVRLAARTVEHPGSVRPDLSRAMLQ